MAKNVIEKKKRIAHNKISFGDHEMRAEDIDMVSCIMQNMDSLPSVVQDLVEPKKIIYDKNVQNTSTSHVSVQKSKKFGISPTFPLMKKCQKDLKQLKHNRRIPKPRAHLAGLSDQTTSLPAKKSKFEKAVEKKIEISHNKVTCKLGQGGETYENRVKKQSLYKTKRVSQKIDLQINESNSSVEETSDIEIYGLKKTNNSSELSDEYEKFIQKEKKELKRKCTNQRKCIKNRKSQSLRRTRKLVSKNISTENDSDSSDDDPKPYCRNRKRLKKVQDNRQSRISIEENSKSEMDVINDETFHDSGSDTVDESNPCGSSFLEHTDSNHNPPSEINSPLHKPSDIAPLMGNDQLNILQERSGTTLLVAIEQPYTTSGNSKIVDPVQSKVGLKDELLGECSTSKNDSINECRKDSSKPLIIDLTESDNECGTPSMPKNVIVSNQNENDSAPHSEESDIELVDVIVYDLKSEDELNVKIEKTPCSNTEPQNTLQLNTELQFPVNRKHEVVYSTGICQQYAEEMESNNNVKKFELDNNVIQNSMPNNPQDAFVFNKVKEEPSDDCTIILYTASTSNSTKNLPTVQMCSNRNVKIEKDPIRTDTANDKFAAINNSKLTQKEQTHQIACSDLKNLATNICNKGLMSLESKTPEPIAEDIRTSLQILKNEFATYQEIIDAEQYVETTFKLLERRQAEKLISIKSRITRLLERSSGDNKDTIRNAMEDCVKVPLVSSATISTQNLKTFAPKNLVPLSSIPENDIKPNLSVLQSELKQEQNSSDEINTTCFGEKCIVCKKDASAACQQCAKVFFCSNECGKKYWEDGHKNACVK